jgi:hypothetical protein
VHNCVHVGCWLVALALLLVTAVSTGCDIPRDSRETLEQVQNASPVADYLSRTIVTGPSFTSATSIIAPKEPIFTGPTPAACNLSQK